MSCSASRGITMKYLCILVLLLTGCAAKKQPEPEPPKESIPKRCIMGGVVNKTKCVPYKKDPNLAICDGVLIKYACVEVEQK
jgi:hypothetical protein